MTVGIMLRSSVFAMACVFASSAAFSEPAPDPNAAKAAKTEAAPKSGEKPADKKPAKAADADKLKRGQYATEAEAKAHCKGEVVWIDEHNFNHYPGSREYGRKPGGFGCDRG
jgi:hypothetical protein